MDTTISCRFSRRVNCGVPTFSNDTRYRTCNYDCGSSDDKLSQPIGVNFGHHQKSENAKFDPNARFYNFTVMMPVFQPLELCEADIIETHHVRPIPSQRQFHAVTSTHILESESQQCLLSDRIESILTIQSSQCPQLMQQSSPTNLVQLHKATMSDHEQTQCVADLNTVMLRHGYFNMRTTSTIHACAFHNIKSLVSESLHSYSSDNTGPALATTTIYARQTDSDSTTHSFSQQHSSLTAIPTSPNYIDSDNYSTTESKQFDPGIGVVLHLTTDLSLT